MPRQHVHGFQNSNPITESNLYVLSQVGSNIPVNKPIQLISELVRFEYTDSRISPTHKHP